MGGTRGVVQAPLTSLVIVSEMTGNRDLTLPLMAVTLLGRGASALVCRESLYRALAAAFIDVVPRAAADIVPQTPHSPLDKAPKPL
jgi:H+/Cl- antiporter ClcA